MSRKPKRPLGSPQRGPAPEKEGGHLSRDRQPGETSEQRWLRILPKPDLTRRDDDAVFMWLHNCLKSGGMEGLAWAWEPRNFPYGPDVRGRNFHTYGQLTREAEARAKQLADDRARELAARNRTDAYEAKRKAGWAA